MITRIFYTSGQYRKRCWRSRASLITLLNISIKLYTIFIILVAVFVLFFLQLMLVNLITLNKLVSNLENKIPSLTPPHPPATKITFLNKYDCILWEGGLGGGIDRVQRLLHNIQNKFWNKKKTISVKTQKTRLSHFQSSPRAEKQKSTIYERRRSFF